MKKCPNCELNYIKDDENLCSVCKQESILKVNSTTDSNKNKVERFLIPFLKSLNQDVIKSLTLKEFSFNVFKIRHPLLIECKNIDKQHCQKEVAIGNSKNYRYYIDPVNINGKYYHICSQWANCGVEESKNVLTAVSIAMSKDKR